MTTQSHFRHASSCKRFLLACDGNCHVPINGNELITEWTGKSIYADKDTPDASNQWTFVDVIVTVGGTLPSGGGTVTLVCIDPPNEYDGTYDDNNSDTFYFVTSQTLTFMPGQFVKTTEVSVGQNAGNNYIIEATANNCYPNQVVESEKLTVWRRLWVECDRMEMPTEGDTDGFLTVNKGNGQGQWNYTAPTPEPDDFDMLFQPDKPDISVLTSAMVAACITVQEVTNKEFTGWSITSRPETPFVHNLASSFDGPTIGNPSRDVNVNNVSFWCIQAVGAYEDKVGDDWDWNYPSLKGEATLGIAYHEQFYNAVLLIFQETIRDFAKSGFRKVWIGPENPTNDDILNKANYRDDTCHRNADELNTLTTFHEMLHFFGFYDETDPWYNPAVDAEIMTHDWIFTETVSSSVLTLSPAQIARIQSKDYPH